MGVDGLVRILVQCQKLNGAGAGGSENGEGAKLLAY